MNKTTNMKRVRDLIKLLNDNNLDSLSVDGVLITKTKHVIKPTILNKPKPKQPMTLEQYVNQPLTDITEDPDFLAATK